MSLVNTKTLTDYDESYLYNQLRSFHESKSDVHYVLTHFVQKNAENKDADQALSRMQREARKTQGVEPEAEPTTVPATQHRTRNTTVAEAPNEPTPAPEIASSANWDANNWGPNTDTTPQVTGPHTQVEPNKPKTTSHIEKIPDSLLRGTQTQDANNNIAPQPTTNNYEPKTAIATRRRPENTPQAQPSPHTQDAEAEQIRLNRLKQQQLKAQQAQREKQTRQQSTQTRSQNNIQAPNDNVNRQNNNFNVSVKNERNVKNTTNNQRVFLNLQKSFETAEWITKSNQMHVATQNALKNMIVDKINIIDLRDNTNTQTYISLSSRTMHLLYSVAIGANLDIILIFNDSTTIKLAPESWLKSTNAQTLIQNEYFYVYKNLNLDDFQQSLKPLVADEINTPEYIQMFLKYSPIVADH